MATCSKCGKVVSFWDLCSDDKHKHIYPECWEGLNKRQEKEEKPKRETNLKEINFSLEKGEKVFGDIFYCNYSGVSYGSFGSGLVGGGLLGNMGGGIFSSQQTKREGSIFDAKKAHAYITNKRLIICEIKSSAWSETIKELGVIAEFPVTAIKSIVKTTKLGMPAIEISVLINGAIDRVRIWVEQKYQDEFYAFASKIKA